MAWACPMCEEGLFMKTKLLFSALIIFVGLFSQNSFAEDEDISGFDIIERMRNICGAGGGNSSGQILLKSKDGDEVPDGYDLCIVKDCSIADGSSSGSAIRKECLTSNQAIDKLYESGNVKPTLSESYASNVDYAVQQCLKMCDDEGSEKGKKAKKKKKGKSCSSSCFYHYSQGYYQDAPSSTTSIDNGSSQSGYMVDHEDGSIFVPATHTCGQNDCRKGDKACKQCINKHRSDFYTGTGNCSVDKDTKSCIGSEDYSEILSDYLSSGHCVDCMVKQKKNGKVTIKKQKDRSGLGQSLGMIGASLISAGANLAGTIIGAKETTKQVEMCEKGNQEYFYGVDGSGGGFWDQYNSDWQRAQEEGLTPPAYYTGEDYLSMRCNGYSAGQYTGLSPWGNQYTNPYLQNGFSSQFMTGSQGMYGGSDYSSNIFSNMGLGGTLGNLFGGLTGANNNYGMNYGSTIGGFAGGNFNTGFNTNNNTWGTSGYYNNGYNNGMNVNSSVYNNGASVNWGSTFGGSTYGTNPYSGGTSSTYGSTFSGGSTGYNSTYSNFGGGSEVSSFSF